jgi:hypothetical protein
MLYVSPSVPANLVNPHQAEVRTFTSSSLSVQALAQLALDLKSGKAANVDISKFENAAFKSFINKKVGNDSLLAVRACKGCHSA